jgi:hypothetical protein
MRNSHNAEAPAWLASLFQPIASNPAAVDRPEGLVADPTGALDDCRRMSGELVAPGMFPKFLWWAANRLVRGRGLAPDAALALFEQHALPRFASDQIAEEHGGIERAFWRAVDHAQAIPWGYLGEYEASKSGWATRWKTVGSFLAEPHPDIVFVTQPFFTSQSLNFIAASPGSFKTWFIMYTAAQAAREGKRVLLVLEEGRPYTLQKRLRMLGVPHEGVSVLIREGLKIDQPATWDAFAQDVVRAGFDMVVLDPFTEFHGADENERAAMGVIMKRLEVLARQGPAVVVVHHTVKAAWGHDRDRPASNLADMRGTGAQSGTVDLQLGLVQTPRAKLKDRKVREAEIYVSKDKDGVVPGSSPDVPSHRLKLTFSEHRMTMVVEPIDFEAENAARKAEKEAKAENQDVDDEAKIVDAFRTHGGDRSKSELKMLSKLSWERVGAALLRMAKNGRAYEENGKWNLVS